jgi:hypothetical protein
VKFKLYTSGQKSRLTSQIKREFKRRDAIEPVIGHLKEHHRMGRNYFAHVSGDATPCSPPPAIISRSPQIARAKMAMGGAKHREVSNAQSRAA